MITPIPMPRLFNIVFPGIARWVLCLMLCATPLAHADTWDLAALMHALAQHPSSRASFVETKTLAMLDAPIESSGELRFQAPDYLEMHTLRPKPQKLVLQGNQLSAEIDGRTHQINLADHPDVAVLIDSIRATLNGDLAALQREYAVNLSGDRAHWSLHLVPSGRSARARVSEIRIDGRRGRVNSVAVWQADGDHSLMTIREHTAP